MVMMIMFACSLPLGRRHLFFLCILVNIRGFRILLWSGSSIRVSVHSHHHHHHHQHSGCVPLIEHHEQRRKKEKKIVNLENEKDVKPTQKQRIYRTITLRCMSREYSCINPIFFPYFFSHG